MEATNFDENHNSTRCLTWQIPITFNDASIQGLGTIYFVIRFLKYAFIQTKLFGLQWQGAPSKNVPGEYRVRFPGEQRLASAHVSTHELD
ncbi:transmembrane protein, putative [Medicago truncatula]|uniref:Transmembrane protein, putative n=1 Tax=Medicago truncatula TaxID=3880 RepID=G7K4C0_MEDTR|nr:transmembrane protein, putative [Medicago truncatula]